MTSILGTVRNSVWDTVRQKIHGVRINPESYPAEMLGEIDTELNGTDSLNEAGSLIEAAVVAAREEYGVFLNRSYLTGLAHTAYYEVVEDLIRLLKSLASWYRYHDGKWVLDVGLLPDLEIVSADMGQLNPDQRYSESAFGTCTETLHISESEHSTVELVFEPAGWPYALQVTAYIKQA